MALVSSTICSEDAKRGEVWKVDFEPTIGSEIQKERPAIVLSLDGIKSLPLRLVVPLTDWKPGHENQLWAVTIEPSVKNGLPKKSVADVVQARCVSTKRFTEKMGFLSAEILEEVAAALAAVIGYV